MQNLEMSQVDDEEDNDEDEENDEEEEDTDNDHEHEDEGEIDKESFKYLLSQFSEAWVDNQINHKVSKTGASKFWNIATKFMIPLSNAFIKEKKKKFPKFEHIRRKLVKKNVPEVTIEAGYVDKKKTELIISEGEKVNVKDFPREKFEKVFEIASVKVLNQIFLALLYILNFSPIPYSNC